MGRGENRALPDIATGRAFARQKRLERETEEIRAAWAAGDCEPLLAALRHFGGALLDNPTLNEPLYELLGEVIGYRCQSNQDEQLLLERDLRAEIEDELHKGKLSKAQVERRRFYSPSVLELDEISERTEKHLLKLSPGARADFLNSAATLSPGQALGKLARVVADERIGAPWWGPEALRRQRFSEQCEQRELELLVELVGGQLEQAAREGRLTASDTDQSLPAFDPRLLERDELGPIGSDWIRRELATLPSCWNGEGTEAEWERLAQILVRAGAEPRAELEPRLARWLSEAHERGLAHALVLLGFGPRALAEQASLSDGQLHLARPGTEAALCGHQPGEDGFCAAPDFGFDTGQVEPPFSPYSDPDLFIAPPCRACAHANQELNHARVLEPAQRAELTQISLEAASNCDGSWGSLYEPGLERRAELFPQLVAPWLEGQQPALVAERLLGVSMFHELRRDLWQRELADGRAAWDGLAGLEPAELAPLFSELQRMIAKQHPSDALDSWREKLERALRKRNGL